MVRKQKLFGHIDKVCTLVEGGGDYQKAFGNLSHIIGGQWVSGQNVRMNPMSHRWTVGVRSKRSSVFLFCVKSVP